MHIFAVRSHLSLSFLVPSTGNIDIPSIARCLSYQTGCLATPMAFRECQTRVLVAVAQGIRFRRVGLTGLKFSLANHTGLTAVHQF